MLVGKVRLPDHDLTYWLDGDGLPQYRGAASKDAIAAVIAVIALSQGWVDLMQEPDHKKIRRAKERALQSQVAALSANDQAMFAELQETAMRLKSVPAVRIEPGNVNAVLALTTGREYSANVRNALVSWAELHLSHGVS